MALNLVADDLNLPAGLALADKTVNNNYAANTIFRNLNFLDGGYSVNATIMGLTGGFSSNFASGRVASPGVNHFSHHWRRTLPFIQRR